MTLDTDTTAPVTDTPAPGPAPEAKAPAGPDPYKEDLSEAEQLDQAEDAELRAAFKRAQADKPSEPEDEDKPQPVRDPKTGKFAPALKEELKTEDDQPKAEKPEAKAEKAVKDADQKPAPKPEEAKKPAVEAPKHWSEKVRQEFAKLDPEAQQELAKEATEMRQHLSRYGRAVKEMEPVTKVLQEHKALFESAGVSPDQGIAALLRAQAALSNPNTARDALLKIAHDFQIDLGTSNAEPDDGDWTDPNIAQLRQEVETARREAHEARQQLMGLSRHLKAQSSEQLVNQFFADKQEEMEALGDDITQRIQMLTAVYPQMPPQERLARAYQEARALSPAYQDKIVSEKMREQAARVEEARRAATLAVQSEPDPLSAASEDEMLRRAYRKGRAA